MGDNCYEMGGAAGARCDRCGSLDCVPYRSWIAVCRTSSLTLGGDAVSAKFEIGGGERELRLCPACTADLSRWMKKPALQGAAGTAEGA